MGPIFLGFLLAGLLFLTAVLRKLGIKVRADKEVQQIKLLTGKYDKYEGVVVEMKEPMDSNAFVSLLRESISQWKQQGKKGVWIKLPLELAYLVAPAVKEGFWYHHAEKDYLMLVNWLPETENTLPSNASHRMGIAAFVINENKEVLVVKERHGSFKGMGWKFPSGTINEGEDICDGAVREVKEETAIDSEFVEILAFRQSHKSFFEKSDVFFLCILKPLSFEIKKQDSEIEEAKWMPFEEYANQELVKKSELMASITEICSEKENGNYVGFSTVPITSKSSGKKSFLYLNRGSR